MLPGWLPKFLKVVCKLLSNCIKTFVLDLGCWEHPSSPEEEISVKAAKMAVNW